MANRRMIYQDFFEDDYFGIAEPLMRLTWIGLITAVADDQGRVLDNSSLIKSKVFVYDRNVNEAMIDEWLCKLDNAGKIMRYEMEGKRLIQIVNWWSYQTPAWANRSKYPAPKEWTDRVRCHVSGNNQGGKVKTINWDTQGGFRGDKKELRSKQGSSQGSGINDVKLRRDNDELRRDKSARADFSEFQQVWEQETGKMIAGFTEFSRMCKRFKEIGVTPELYRTAIKEQQISQYAVKRPTGVEEWAVRLATTNKNGNGKLSQEEQDNATINKVIEEMVNANNV